MEVPMQAREKDNRRDWIIVIVIILVGLLCILLAGGWALRLTPSWKLDSDMGSNLDPNSDFLTARSNGFVEPIDPSILTRPAWLSFGSYLTPGASFNTGTPAPTSANTQPPLATKTSISTLNPTPTGTLAITAAPTNTSISYPTSPPVRTATPSATSTATADLRITITDGSITYIVGGTRTYTIVVYNSSGPSNINGATVVDNFPAVLSGITWSCVGSGGATCTANGTGNINDSVNLPVGSFVTYTVNANVSPAATGNLVNTASVAVPVGISDPAPANNTATDTDTPLFNVDLRITKTDGVATYTPGTSVTYSIIVTNTGPANATGATVADTFSAQATGVSWTCAAAGGANCTASGTGNINDTVNIPVGGTVTYTAIVAISPSATTNLVNTATVTAPGGYSDTAPGNNFATDTDTPLISADLSITKTSPSTSYSAGSTITYTIVVTNNGPNNVTAATISDPKPSQVTTWGWCVAPCVPVANSAAGLSDTINLASGASITYAVSANINTGVTGDLVNTATVAVPTGVTDSAPGNNSATYTHIPNVDLQITKDDGSATYTAGGSSTYTVTVTNNSTFNLTGITVTDNIPSLVTTWGWCVAPCAPAATATTNLSDTINLTAGASISYNILANINAFAAGDLSNTATVNVPAGYVDAIPGNNSATDTNINQTGEPDIGPPDTGVYPIGDGGSVTFYLSQPIRANGDTAADFVFYELQIGADIFIDQIIIEISMDGTDWRRVFYWGDTNPDTNTNVDNLNLPNINAVCPTEIDNCSIPISELYNNNSSGITIDVDNSPLSVVPIGDYYWIRFTEPGITPGDGAHVDSIQILP